MKIQFTVEPTTLKHENNTLRMRLLFESNINMHQTYIDRIFSVDDKIDRRKRLIDDMFYELRQRVTENETAFNSFLDNMR